MYWYSETWQNKEKRLSSVHKWFAWKPVRVNDRIYWLQTIYRKGTRHCRRLNTALLGDWWAWSYAENEFDILKEM